MILLSQHKYTPTSGNGPFTYHWSSDNDCVSFDKPSGTVSSGHGFVTLIYVTDATCFAYGTDAVNLTLTDSNGCQTIHTFYPSDPCTTLTLTDISAGFNSVFFSIAASGGAPEYNFDWTVTPAGLFTVQVLDTSSNSTGASNIQLSPVLNSPKKPDSFTVTCTVTDQNGCIATKSRTFGIRGVQLDNITASADCIYSGNQIPMLFSPFKPLPIQQGFSAGPLRISYNFTNGCAPDWSTLKFTLPDTSIQYAVSTIPFPSVTFYGLKSTLFNNGVLIIPFTVLDCNGVGSNEAYITLTESDCNTSDTVCPLIVNNLCITDCEDVVTINLDGLILSPNCCDSNSIDWSTFEIVPGTPIDPATVEFNGATHTLTYTSNGSSNLADLIQWSIADALGNHSGVHTIQIARNCPADPACLDDCYYVSSNAVDQPLHVLLNDLGPNLVQSTLIITTPPTHGTAYVFDGDIYYTPFAAYEGTDTLIYSISDSNGNSCTANVTLNIAADGPAGTGNTIISCTSSNSITALINIPPIVDSSGRFDLVFQAYNNASDPLDLNDEIDVDIIVSGVTEASATLLVGSNYKTTVKSGTDNNWLTGDNFAQYLSPSTTLNSLDLITGQTIKFNKLLWAHAKGYTNTYSDPYKGGSTVLAAKEVTVRIKARSIANATESSFSSDIVEKVKRFSFEDTYHLTGGAENANGAGTWEWYGSVGTENRGETCNSGTCNEGANIACEYHNTGGSCNLASWYSQYTTMSSPAGLTCPDYGTAELKNLVRYKIVGSSEVVPSPIPFTTEAEMTTVINGIQSLWAAGYFSYNYFAGGSGGPYNYNVWGHQSGYINSQYLVASFPELEYFVLEYVTPGTCNEGKQVKCTTVSHIFF